MTEIYIDDVEELVKIINSFSNNYIYRGQSDSNWLLKSTLERIIGEKFKTDFAKYEGMSLNLFKNKFHLYDNSNTRPETKLGWLSIMQHYGVPTRLLDFTTSPYVALYFAIEAARKQDEKNLSLYAIDYRAVMKRTLEIIKKTDKKFNIEYDEVNYIQDQIFEETIDRYSLEVLWVTEPQLANLRLDRQAGCFLFASTVEKSFEELLNSVYNDVDFQKINISYSFWDNIFTMLSRVNINSKTIYGDLEGLSNSIKMMIKAYS